MGHKAITSLFSYGDEKNDHRLQDILRFQVVFAQQNHAHIAALEFYSKSNQGKQVTFFLLNYLQSWLT